jgi:hypothetical protein
MSANSNNKSVLDAASIRIDQLDIALGKFDALSEQQIQLESDLKIASSQEQKILDDESLNHSQGAQQLVQARAMLDVLKRRLENGVLKIDEAKKAVFDTGAQAMEAAFSVWAKLRENREARAKTVFAEHFRLPSHWPVREAELFEGATLVRQVTPLQFGFQLQHGHSTEAKLDALRTLRGRFESLRQLAEAEPNLDFAPIAKAPALSVVAA